MNPSSKETPPVIPVATVTSIVLVWYCITILVSRLITHVLAPGISVESGGLYHWHHIIWGIVLMAIGGFMGLYWSEKLPVMAGSLFLGIGLGLSGDELGLVLLASTGLDGYFDPISFPLMIIIAELLFIAYLAARKQNR